MNRKLFTVGDCHPSKQRCPQVVEQALCVFDIILKQKKHCKRFEKAKECVLVYRFSYKNLEDNSNMINIQFQNTVVVDKLNFFTHNTFKSSQCSKNV